MNLLEVEKRNHNMVFKKGHSGFKKKATDKADKKKKCKDGNSTLDTYFHSKPKFKKLGKFRKLLDSDQVDHYLNNNMDVTELYGTDEEWNHEYLDENGKKLTWYQVEKKRKDGDKDL